MGRHYVVGPRGGSGRPVCMTQSVRDKAGPVCMLTGGKLQTALGLL